MKIQKLISPMSIVVLILTTTHLYSETTTKEEAKNNERKTLMRNMSGTLEDLEKSIFSEESEKSKETVLEHTLLLKEFSKKINKNISDSDIMNDTKSKDWSESKNFDTAAKALEAKMDELMRAVEKGEKNSIQDTYTRLEIKSVCIQCHSSYREGDPARGVPEDIGHNK